MTDIAQFVGSIGVNTHVDATGSAYGNIALVQASLAYIGISFIRDHAYDIDLDAYTALANAGIGLDLILDDDPKAEIDSLITLAPAIRTFEGPNEVDYQPILTNGIADPVLAAVTEQQSVQAAIRATALVSTLPLLAESMADPGNLSVFAGNLDYADFSNLHAYAVQGQSPYALLADRLAIAQSLAPDKPVALTETGYFTLADDSGGNGVDETVQAKLTLDTLFDSASLGISLTFLYELFDEPYDPNAPPSELHYGLFNADGSPKLAATALHNLTDILAAANTTPGTAPALALSTSDLPETGHTLVLTGDAGTTVVAIWAEPQIWDGAAHAEIAVPITTTTINFGMLAASAIVLDPLTGTDAIAIYTNVSSITVALTDHPLLIAISAPTPVPPTPVTTPDPTPPVTTPPATTPDPTPPVTTPPVTTPDPTPPVTTTPVTTPDPTPPVTTPPVTTPDPTPPVTTTPITTPDPTPPITTTPVTTPDPTPPVTTPPVTTPDPTPPITTTPVTTPDPTPPITTTPVTTPDPTTLVTPTAGISTGSSPATTAPLDRTIGVYRFFDKSNGTYFYTANASEAQTVRQTRPDLVAEGTGGIGLVAIAPASSDPYASPVYRFFDVKFGTHFFTASTAERDTIIATRADLSYEPNSTFYEHTTYQAGDTPVYRFFDNVHGTHFYTDNATERAAIISTRTDLVSEGIGFYEPPANPA